jgi:hypothetical protein
MPAADWAKGLVPYGADQTVYLVVDSFGADGTVYREIEVERTDLESIFRDFLTGQFNYPVRVIAFNTLQHWSEDVSQEIAAEIQSNCDMNSVEIPVHVRDFVLRHSSQSRQRAPHYPLHQA